jgi:hypothetical protein
MAAVRHGSRWLHEEPTEEEVREWFGKQSLHDGMDHDPYLGGIVLIAATEKLKVTKEKQNGEQYVAEVERAVFVPYVKVDTRITYFWNLVRAMNAAAGEDKYIGTVEPVEQRRTTAESSAWFNGALPEGFTSLPIRNENNSISRYIVATWEAAIWERQSYGKRLAGQPALPVLRGVGTKQTPLARKWADDNALMKAETGAIGRALGVAGILVVGTGVATAEDMQEAAQGPSGAAAASDEGPALPDIEGGGAQAGGFGQVEEIQTAVPAETTPAQDDEELRKAALEAQRELEADYPEVWAEILTWWKAREFGRLSELTGPALKGAVIKLQRDLDTAKRGGDTPHEPDPTATAADES